MNIPKDPIMLMSFLNTQLRDKYTSLADLTATYGIDEAEVTEKLAAVGYKYSSERNQFVRES